MWVPPKSVQLNAELGLALRVFNEESRGLKRPGGTEIGVARAVQLSSGKPVTPRAAKRMSAYFSRHQKDKQAAGWGDEEKPSPGYVAWLLWGSDEGWAWANRLVAEMKRSKLKKNPYELDRLEEIADEGYGNFEDYFEESAAGELDPEVPYYGRNVIWDGIDGRMLRVYPRYARVMPENIFDPDKLAAVRDGITYADDRVVFTAPYGEATVIGPSEIKESIELADEYPDFVLTTGDIELDSWLEDPETYRDEDQQEFMQDLNKAMARGDGDLGKILVTMRDGNHRAFGAFLAGEPYIYSILYENQFQDLDPNDLRDSTIIESLE